MTRKSALKSREMVTISKAEYERLREIEREAEEDAGTARAVARAKKETESGAPLIPKKIVDRLVKGENAIRVFREYRETTQRELAAGVEITQGYLSDLENGKRKGPLSLHSKISQYLKVPLDLLAASAVPEEEAVPERLRKRRSVVQSMIRPRSRR